jgi:hypothetical protein
MKMQVRKFHNLPTPQNEKAGVYQTQPFMSLLILTLHILFFSRFGSPLLFPLSLQSLDSFLLGHDLVLEPGYTCLRT